MQKKWEILIFDRWTSFPYNCTVFQRDKLQYGQNKTVFKGSKTGGEKGNLADKRRNY